MDMSLEERLSKVETEIKNMKDDINHLGDKIDELTEKVNTLLGQTSTIELLVKFVILPLIFIVGAIVGVKITLPP